MISHGFWGGPPPPLSNSSSSPRFRHILTCTAALLALMLGVRNAWGQGFSAGTVVKAETGKTGSKSEATMFGGGSLTLPLRAASSWGRSDVSEWCNMVQQY